ncbi:hypothetical protein EUTSA_v10003434mg [Eutrema salsugineum]|uniref:Uncharacterized protein n=1 Tax=Eutrema salsugineum TaxID=72664 RepID=V4LM34_EUTSA|nr:hypothetical protein EUTSA_v10003434mg [Eutrema salsugineum]
MAEPTEMEIYLGNGDDSVGAHFSYIVLEPISWPLESQLTLEWVKTLLGLLNQFTWKNSVVPFNITTFCSSFPGGLCFPECRQRS